MRRKLTLNRVAFLGALILMLVVFVPTSLALGLRGGERVVIEADEVIDDDYYVVADEFILNGVVKGDLFVGGRKITINGTVEGDLWAVGQWVRINGVVGDDARIGGAVLELGSRAEVVDDLMVAGYSYEAESGSIVGGTFVFAGAQALLAGDIGEDVYVASNGLEIRGRIGGNVKAEVGYAQDVSLLGTSEYWPEMPPVPQVRGGLTLHEDAEIGGSLEYKTVEAITVPGDVVKGTERFIPDMRERVSEGDFGRALTTYWFWRQTRRFLALVIVALLLAWLAPKWITIPAGKLKVEPGPSLGWGALIWFCFPIALLIVIILIGLVAALLGVVTLGELSGWFVLLSAAALLALIAVYGSVSALLAKILVAYWIGTAILSSTKLADMPKRIWSILLGLAILSVVMAIPCLGTLVGIVVSMFGLGALLLLAREWGWFRRSAGTAVPEKAEQVEDLLATQGEENDD